jgi:AraC-like DNA-binding protein
VPRSGRWQATLTQADAGEFIATDTTLPADLTFTNDGHGDGYVIDTLLAADPARDTVTAIAYRWGFASPSRFAVYYRTAYGILPSHALRHD